MRLSALLVGLSMCQLLLNAADPFEITIYRSLSTEKCLSGYFAVNGQIICYSLERPWHDNAENISAIPAGTYHAFLRYDKKDHWRIQLEVPRRPGVEIHIGNEVDDTKGCILVGKSLDSSLCRVKQSATAYAALRKAFYGTDNPSATPDKEIQVVVKDVGKQ